MFFSEYLATFTIFQNNLPSEYFCGILSIFPSFARKKGGTPTGSRVPVPAFFNYAVQAIAVTAGIS